MMRPKAVNEEVSFDGRCVISETDKSGVITFVNRKFEEMNGYKKNEVVGKTHSILRHPDMPKDAFTGLWRSITMGYRWEGFVKTLRKDGKFYWSDVSIVPKKDAEDNIVGYIASRKATSKASVIQAEKTYKKMK